MFTDSLLIDQWGAEKSARFGTENQLSQHNLHQLEMFSEASIIDLLNVIPRNLLQSYTMRSDAKDMDSVTAVDIQNCSGADLMQAVNNGLFWFNLKRLETFDHRYQELLDEMFAQLRQHCPQLEGAYDLSCDMLITSADSHTHFHMDRGPSTLWHISGQKRLWCYPPMDFSLISQQHVEQIFSGERLEYTPYSEEFDRLATYQELQAGEVVSWPNSAPHRVENITPCVSINVSYACKASVRRSNIQCANRHILRPLGIDQPSANEDGLGADIKEFGYRAANRLLKFKPANDFRADYATDLRINTASENCLQILDKKVIPEFLNK